jgi:hypothetical protein
MTRILKCFVGLAMFVAFLAGPAAAHNLTVSHPGTGEPINEQWVGGPLLPAQATGEGLLFHPLGLQPAAHNHGLPVACSSTESSPTVTILAPPLFTTCIHGNP